MKIIKNLTFAALAATLLFQTSVTRAADARDHRDATVTWTKWITSFYPDGPTGIFATIEGLSGGDIGDGTVTGEAITAVPRPGGGFIVDAIYHFVGSKHSFTVHFQSVQEADNSGVVIGVVTDGWLKGNVVIGQYTGRTCDQGIAGVCFDGTFVIKKGSKNKD